MAAQHHDVVIVGGGLAGIVTALEALRAGQSVALVDRDAPERLGGLALWAFGGMALVGTALQARMKIPDSPEAALRDWVRFGEMDPADTYPQQWARYYVEHSRAEVYDWLLGEGVKFMPAVNWIERGRHGEGNSVPRYHIIWGTARELTRRMIAAMRQADTGGRLTVLHRHRASALDLQQGRTSGVLAVNEDTGAEVRLTAAVVVLAVGGINGGHAQTRANWPTNRPCPPPCSMAHTPLPTERCTTTPPIAGARRSPTQARCGTTQPVFRTLFRISRGMACPPFRANRRCGSTTGANASARNRWSPVSTPTGCASKWPRKRSPGPGTC